MPKIEVLKQNGHQPGQEKLGAIITDDYACAITHDQHRRIITVLLPKGSRGAKTGEIWVALKKIGDNRIEFNSEITGDNEIELINGQGKATFECGKIVYDDTTHHKGMAKATSLIREIISQG
jgi:hypothetical protein